MQRIDIGIIGGGASGLMAAVAAADSVKGRPCEIIIFEKKDRVGKKLLATGNGKCNLTNLSFSVENPGFFTEAGTRSCWLLFLPGSVRRILSGSSNGWECW